jgi:hypothetical protein
MAVMGITDRGGVRGEELELVVGAADAAIAAASASTAITRRL